MSVSAREARSDSEGPVRLHLKLGWLWIGFFSMGGLVLEGLHGFKLGFYLDVGNETRRLMWTLAHTHGTLLGLVHLAYAFSLGRLPLSRGRLSTTSRLLVASGIFLPAGFFLGGLFVFGGDPGRGIFLVPLGGALLVVAAFLLAFASYSTSVGEDGSMVRTEPQPSNLTEGPE